MSEVYIDKHGMAHDDEGHTWSVGKDRFYPGTYSGKKFKGPKPSQDWRGRSQRESEMVKAISKIFSENPGDAFLREVFRQSGNVPMYLSKNQKKMLRDIMNKNGMRKEAKLFEERDGGMRKLLNKIEEKVGMGMDEGEIERRLKLFNRQHPMYKALDRAMTLWYKPGNRGRVPVSKKGDLRSISHQEARALIAHKYATRGSDSDSPGVIYFIDMTDKGVDAHQDQRDQFMEI